MKAEKNSVWLVKSGGHILGPYAERQISDLIRERAIVPLDEISRPCDRWLYVRDVPAFAKVIESLRARNLSGVLDDETTTHLETDTSTAITDSLSSVKVDDLTEDLSYAISNSSSVQDIMFHSIDDNPSAQVKVSAESFTHENDYFIKQQADQSSRWLWAITAVVILAVSAYVVFAKFVAKPIQNQGLARESYQNGVRALDLGDYQAALDDFKRVYSLDPQDSRSYLYLGILQIQIDQQPFQGRTLLERLIAYEHKDLKRIYTGIGLSYLREGDIAKAEQNFNKALDLDPLYTIAVINLGASAVLAQDWPKANNHLQLAVKDGSRDGAELMLLIQVLVKLFQLESEPRYLNEALKYIQQFSKSTRNYFMESAIAEAFVAYLNGDRQSVYGKIDKILDLDTEETSSHRQNLFIYRESSSWALVSQWCLKLTQDLEPTPKVVALEALCLMKSGELVEANKKIDDALNQAPKEPLVLSTYAILLEHMNSNDKAKIYVDKAIELDSTRKFTQPSRVMARICQKSGDAQCEMASWRLVLSKDPQSLAANTGMAMSLLKATQVDEAKKYIDGVLKLAPNYRPALALSHVLSEQNLKSNELQEVK